jgi:hypothetical protein
MCGIIITEREIIKTKGDNKMMIIKKYIKVAYDNNKIEEYQVKDYTVRGSEVTLFFDDNTTKILKNVLNYMAFNERRFTK